MALLLLTSDFRTAVMSVLFMTGATK